MELIEKVKKRTGLLMDFEPEKITSAISKAMLAVRGNEMQGEAVKLSRKVLENVTALFGSRIPDVESIQDQVERVLMESGYYDVARAYILYRERRRSEREKERQEIAQKIQAHDLRVTKRDGSLQPFSSRKLERFLRRAVEGYEGVIDSERLLKKCLEGVFEGIGTAEVARLAVMTARAFVEEDPSYDVITTRLFLSSLYKEVIGGKFESAGFEKAYREAFVKNIRRGVEMGRLTPHLLEMDLARLAKVIDPSRDQLLRYRGIQTLYDRYLVHERDERRLESPQAFWMRVCMGLALAEAPTERENWAITFYEQLSSLRFVSSTPTLFHAGTKHPQLSSCYITKVDDSLEHIFKSIGDNAQLSKWSGGLGNDWTAIRGMGSPIQSTGVESQGVIPFLKIANDTTAAINRSGKRRGATCAYLENWHLDIEDFLDLRRNTGDERRRAHDMNTAVWIPDLFMKRVLEEGSWTLFSPSDTPDLHETYGKEFEKRYTAYEERAAKGEFPLARKMPALELWRKMVTRLFETGHPWMTFKDPCNVRSPQDHAGVIHSSNLCCMTGDQRVVTKDGLLTVKALYERGTPNLVLGRHGIVEASKMLLPRPHAPIVQVLTEEGYQHKVTPDHKLWVAGRGWVEAQHLQAGDKLEIQQRPGMWGKSEHPAIAAFCGFVAAQSLQEQPLTELSALLEAHTASLAKLPSEIAQALSIPRDIDALSTQLRALQIDLASLPNALPAFLWESSQSTVTAYLRALFAHAAYLQDGMVHQESSCTLLSHSPALLEEIQILLANLAIKCRRHPLDRTAWQHNNSPVLQRQAKAEAACWALSVDSLSGCQRLESLLQIGQILGEEDYLESITTSKLNPPQMTATFLGLAPLPNEDAYCLEVYTDEHSWTVNGLITKNTEITLNTSAEETAVCNLSSVNLAMHIRNQALDSALLRETVRVGMRMLDNVIDINFYPTPEAKAANLRHRPVGLGIMGFQDALFQMEMRFDSQEAMDFADESMEQIAYAAILASTELAKERGAYASYRGSKWDRGLLPQDTLDLLEAERGLPIETPRKGKLDWSPVRQAIQQYGMRNSNCMAIAPTATISNLAGCFPSIEPIYKNLYVKSNMSGEFTVANYYLIEDLKARGLWNPAMLEELKIHDGSLLKISSVPEELRHKYKTSFEIEPEWLIMAAARRGKWIDQSQSLNLFLQTTSGRRISEVYLYAWKMGLKTTYYLRTLGASSVEKSTVDLQRTLAKQAPSLPPGIEQGAVCDPTDPTCEACQ